MPILKGKWYFKDKLDLDQSDVYFLISLPDGATTFFRSNGIDYCALYIRGKNDPVNTSSMPPVVYGWGSIFPYGTEDGSEGIYGIWKTGYQQIEFTQSIEVSEEFYNWFTKNAVDLQPTGTWRFNKNLKHPNTDIPIITVMTNHAGDASDTGTVAFANMGDIEIMGLALHASSTSQYQLDAYTIGPDGDAWFEEFYKEGNGWSSDYTIQVQEITFYNQLEQLNPEFALWFYENAHSMELKLYSECYIAEAVDTIRSITGSTKGYTVKDLSAGIEEVKQSAVSYTGSTWTFKDGIVRDEWSAYIHEKGEERDYGGAFLHFDINFTVPEGCVFDGDDESKTDTVYSFKRIECYIDDGDEADSMCYFPTDDSIPAANYYVGDAGVFEQGATIKLEEEPSAELLDFLNTFATKVGEVALPDLTNPATTGDVLAGKEYIDADGNKKAGTMPEAYPTVDGIDYYGINYVNDDNKLVLQLGYHQPQGGYMAAGANSYDGPVVTNIPASSGIRVIPGTADKVAVNAGYYVESDAVVAGDSNLIASNIKKDTTIFGVTGTYTGSGSTIDTVTAGVYFYNFKSLPMMVTIRFLNANLVWETKTATILANTTPTLVNFTAVSNSVFTIGHGNGTAVAQVRVSVDASTIGYELASDSTSGQLVSIRVTQSSITHPFCYIEEPTNDNTDLEALGALCEWEIVTDAQNNSYPIIKIVNMHPTYSLRASLDIGADYEIWDAEGEWISDQNVSFRIGPDDDVSFYPQAAVGDLTISVENIRWTKT